MRRVAAAPIAVRCMSCRILAAQRARGDCIGWCAGLRGRVAHCSGGTAQEADQPMEVVHGLVQHVVECRRGVLTSLPDSFLQFMNECGQLSETNAAGGSL